LDDDEQVRWFVEQHGLRERYPDYSDRQIITELGILALLNTKGLMIDLFYFQLQPLSDERLDSELIIKELKDTQSYYDLRTLLEKHHIVVVLRN
jgi:hypothetical protein